MTYIGIREGCAVPPDSLSDGLYWVEHIRLPHGAGFCIRDGVLITCSPLLTRRLAYWFSIAIRIGDA